MTCLSNEFPQLSISVVFLQMHKLMPPMNVMQLSFSNIIVV